MAQVRKFDKGTNEGGITTQPDLFEWEGVGSYERKPMIQTLTKNLAGYADYLGLTGDRRNRFLTNGAAAIKALEAGYVKKLADGSYGDASRTMSSTGEYDKNWLGKLKDTDNNAYNDISKYFDAYIDKASIYDPEKTKKEAEEKAKKDKTSFGGDAFLKQQLSKSLYAGSFSEDDWFNHRTVEQRNKAIADIFNNADYADIYNKYLWDNTGIDSAEALKQRGLAFAQQISNNKLEDIDYNTAAALGISNLKAFLEKQEEPQSKEPTREEQQAAEKEAYIKELTNSGYELAEAERLWELDKNKAARDRQAKIQEAEDAEKQALESQEWDTWYAQHNHPDTSKLAGTVGGDVTDFSKDSVTDWVKKQFNGDINAYFDEVGKVLMGQLRWKGRTGRDAEIQNLRRLRYAAANYPGYFGKALPTGEYIIHGTENDDNYTAYVFNPSTNSYKQVSFLANALYKDYAKDIWYSKRTASHKEGGIVKMQDGGYADYQRSLQEGRNASLAQFQEDYNAREKQRAADKKVKRQPNPAKARDYVRTGDQIEAGKKQIGTPGGEYQWTTADKIRLGTIGADVLSTITSTFLPGYGTAAAAGLGVLSTGTNFGLDLADKSVSTGQAFANLGIGLGMDLVGLVPGLGVGAKATKIARLVKPISKTLIWGLRAVGTAQAYNSIGAINKLLTTPDKMTVDDWRDIAGGVQAVMGLANYRAGKRQVNNNTIRNQVVDINGADRRRYTISKSDYEKLKSTKGKEAQDKLFKELTGSEKGLTREIKDKKTFPGLGWSIPGTGHDPGRFRTELSWMDAPEASLWNGFTGYNKGDRAFIRFYQDKPRGSLSRPSTSQKQSRKRIQKTTRTSNLELSTQEKEYINNINAKRKAAGKGPLTDQEILNIRNRRANANRSGDWITQHQDRRAALQERIGIQRDVARARAELAEADARIAARSKSKQSTRTYSESNPNLPVKTPNWTEPINTRQFVWTARGPVQSAGRPAPHLLTGHPTITQSNRMLPAPKRVKISTVNVPRKVNAAVIDKSLGLDPFQMGISRTKRQADLEAALGPIALKEAKINAEKRVKASTRTPNMSLQSFIDSKLPKKPLTGAARTSRQKSLDNTLKSRQAKDNRSQGAKKAAQTRKTAESIVKRNTKQPTMSIQELIDSRIPKRPSSGAARKSKQKSLDKVLGPRQKEINRKEGSKKAAKTRAENRRIKARDEKLATMGGAYKLGGRLIPKFYGGTTKTGVQRLTGDWYGNIGSTFMEDLGSGLDSGTYTYKAINDLANTHSGLRTANPNVNSPSWSKDVEDYYNLINDKFSFINTKGITAGENNARYKTAKNVDTGDNAGSGWKADGYFSGKGLDRTPLGYVGDYTDEELAKAQKFWNSRNLELFDTGDANHAYNLRPIIANGPSLNTKATVTIPDKLPGGFAGGKSGSGTTARAGATKTKDGKSGKGWNLMPEDVLATSRALIGFGVNARAARQQKAGMRPLITDTWENVVSPEWDYFAQRAGEDAYAGLTSFAGRTRTANSQDQFAGQLEAENKGRQFITQGNQQAANRFYATDRLRQQESDAAKARRVENANANTGRMLAVDAAKHQIDAALTTAQYAQVLAPWMAGIENQYRQNRAAQRQMDASAYQRSLLASMQAKYDKAVESGDQKKVDEVTNEYYSELQKYNKRAYSSPWLIQRTTSMPSSNEYGWIDYAKQGGRLTAREREVIQRAKDFNKRMLEDNKQFHKDIMESKREHNKLIAGMSNLTADLIKNGMKWK